MVVLSKYDISDDWGRKSLRVKGKDLVGVVACIYSIRRVFFIANRLIGPLFCFDFMDEAIERHTKNMAMIERIVTKKTFITFVFILSECFQVLRVKTKQKRKEDKCENKEFLWKKSNSFVISILSA